MRTKAPVHRQTDGKVPFRAIEPGDDFMWGSGTLWRFTKRSERTAVQYGMRESMAFDEDEPVEPVGKMDEERVVGHRRRRAKFSNLKPGDECVCEHLGRDMVIEKTGDTTGRFVRTDVPVEIPADAIVQVVERDQFGAVIDEQRFTLPPVIEPEEPRICGGQSSQSVQGVQNPRPYSGN